MSFAALEPVIQSELVGGANIHASRWSFGSASLDGGGEGRERRFIACWRSYSSDSAGVIMEERDGPISESESESESGAGGGAAGERFVAEGCFVGGGGP